MIFSSMWNVLFSHQAVKDNVQNEHFGLTETIKISPICSLFIVLFKLCMK